MAENELFSISDFARFSRTTRNTLLHYDRIGLLSPASYGKNRYRYYSAGQLVTINVIRTLQALGMSLAEIQEAIKTRTPRQMDALFSGQIVKINNKINEWNRARDLLLTLQESIHSVLEIDENAVTAEILPEEKIILGSQNDYSGGKDSFDALFRFYSDMEKKNLDLNFPVWGVFSENRIKKGDWVFPDRYYFCNPNGPDARPSGLYVIGYSRGGYGQSDRLYRKLIQYIEKNGYRISGDAYEEYPLNEVCLTESNGYLIRLMITVREKRAGNFHEPRNHVNR